MKRSIFIAFLAALICVAGACSSIKPLQPRYYRKNVIVKADGSIWTNGKKLQLNNLRGQLVEQMIFEETPIAVHFHQNLTREDFDRIMTKLAECGFKNCETTVYRD